ncbi:hypothetical protein AGDE_13644 [Angomonas deanei]|nr:hypothetical protein AGDE_13644 [Angomonas deanei]|eukprot:EPY21950.1 hypothetical protein AGDE_13644 [Angomonas deanei]
MPIIQDLCNTYTNSAIVHWLHDAYEMQNWKGFADIKVEVPLLLLQTTSYPSSSLPRYRPTVEETPYVLYSRQYHSDKDLENLNHGHTTEEEAKYYEQVRQNLKRVAALRADIQKEVRSSLLDVEKGKNTSDERAPDDDDEAENDNRTEDEVLEKLVSEGNLLDKYKLNSKQRLHLDEV